MNQRLRTKIKPALYPLLIARDRFSVWEKVRGMWKNRKPEPIRELKKMRREWDRKLPSLH